MNFEQLTEERKAFIKEMADYYCSDNLKNLRKICDPIILQKNEPDMFHDDLYDNAMWVLLETAVKFDKARGVKFSTLLTKNIKNSFYDWTRDKERGRRCNVKRNKIGRIVKDENGRTEIINNLALDSTTEEGKSLYEMVASSFDLGEAAHESNKIHEYLEKLSAIERRIVLLLAEGYQKPEIRKKLSLTEKDYSNCMENIRSYEYVSILF